jgi:hypothetical protein
MGALDSRGFATTRRRAVWAPGLATWLVVHAAAAQDRGGPAEAAGGWEQLLASAADGEGIPGRTLPDDRDLVRSGVFARWAETIAVGATPTLDGAADLDGDGGVDRLLTVAPCADPYPFNEEAGMVLVRSVPGGFRATVLLRGGFSRGGLSWRVDVRRGRPLVTAVVVWGGGHASEGFWSAQERHRFRLTRGGGLRFVERCRLWSHSEAALPDRGVVTDGSGGRCW